MKCLLSSLGGNGGSSDDAVKVFVPVVYAIVQLLNIPTEEDCLLRVRSDSYRFFTNLCGQCRLSPNLDIFEGMVDLLFHGELSASSRRSSL